jgi:hypothetical protein
MRSAVFFVLAFMIAVVAPGSSVYAQAVPGGSEPLTISIAPANPRPYDSIAITPRSNLINLPASTVTISVNGSIIEEGSGGRSVTTTLGGPGTKSVIRVTAVFEGTTYAKEVIIAPADVALVVEPLTGTHPFYDGAALVAPEGRVRVVAMTDFRTGTGARIPSNQLAYTWKLGERVLTEQSGIGRSTLSATAAPRYRDARVSVTVATVDGAVNGGATAIISAGSPELLIYRDDPLLGIDFAHALSGTFSMSGEEETFRAVSYHFGNAPGFSWSLNGSAAGSDERLTVRTTGNERGTALLRAVATDGAAGESADASFTVDFGGRSSGGFFGF